MASGEQGKSRSLTSLTETEIIHEESFTRLISRQYNLRR